MTYVLVTEQHVDLLVFGGDPRNPVKVGQEASEVIGEPRPNKGANGGITEESFSGQASALVLSKTFVFDGVQSVEKGSVDQCRRPDHGRWPDQHLSVETTWEDDLSAGRCVTSRSNSPKQKPIICVLTTSMIW